MNRKDGPLRNHVSIWPFSGLIGGIINAEGGKGPAESCHCPGTVCPLGAQLSHWDEEPNRWPRHALQLRLLHKHYPPLPPGTRCRNGWLSIASRRWTRGENGSEFDQDSLVMSRDSKTLALSWFLCYDWLIVRRLVHHNTRQTVPNCLWFPTACLIDYYLKKNSHLYRLNNGRVRCWLNHYLVVNYIYLPLTLMYWKITLLKSNFIDPQSTFITSAQIQANTVCFIILLLHNVPHKPWLLLFTPTQPIVIIGWNVCCSRHRL